MKNLKFCAVLRAVAWMCLYFAILSLFGIFDPWKTAMILIAVASLAVGLLAIRCDSVVLRLVLSLLPAAALLLGKASIYMAFPFIGCLFFTIVITIGNFDIHIDQFRRSFSFGLVCAVAVLIVGIISTILSQKRFMCTETVLYVSAFFLLYMFSLRSMQMGRTYMSGKMRALTALSVVGVPLLIVGVSVLLGLLLDASAPFLAVLLAPLVSFLKSLAVTIFPQEAGPDVTIQPMTTVKPQFRVQGPGAGSILDGLADESVTTDSTNIPKIGASTPVGVYVVIALLVIACICIAVALSRRARNCADDLPAVEENIEEVPFERSSSRKSSEPQNANVKLLRKIYRSYLKFIQSLRMRVGQADTSQDVLERAQALPDREENERLRELYIAARYGDPDSITSEHIAEAKQCLETIKADADSKLENTPTQGDG